MGKCIGARRGFVASSAVVFVWLLAACSARLDGPAPVIGGVPEQQPASVIVQRGQTLSGIAQTYHVPMRAVAAANPLSPPYRIEVGRTLLIPAPDGPVPSSASASVAALSASPNPEIAAAPRPPAAIPSPLADTPSVAVLPPPAPVASIPAVPPPTKSQPAGEPAPLVTKPVPAPPAPTAASQPPASPRPSPPPAHGSSAFAWPVRGRVLASYGSGQDGAHNDGINIAAPRGAAVQAADSGVVAYAGNELRGYGNLILVKHANGWISAYAHCDVILVKRGDKVERGQVIARVGSTGNVGEPQLHFELRRGNHAVHPREFMVPLATAGTPKSSPPG